MRLYSVYTVAMTSRSITRETRAFGLSFLHLGLDLGPEIKARDNGSHITHTPPRTPPFWAW